MSMIQTIFLVVCFFILLLLVVFKHKEQKEKKMTEKQNNLQKFFMQGKRKEAFLLAIAWFVLFVLPAIILWEKLYYVLINICLLVIGLLMCGVSVFAYFQEVEIENNDIKVKIGKKTVKQCIFNDIKKVTCCLRGKHPLVVYKVYYLKNGKVKKLFSFEETNIGEKLFLKRIKPYKVLIPVYANNPSDFFVQVVEIIRKSFDADEASRTLKTRFDLNEEQIEYIFSLKIKEIDYKNNYKKEMEELLRKR